jgi:hypothetical protein
MPNTIMIDLKGALKVLKLLLAVLTSFLRLRLSDLLYAVNKGDSQSLSQPTREIGHQARVTPRRYAGYPDWKWLPWDNLG